MTAAGGATRRGALLVAGAAVCWSSGALIARLVATTPWTTSLWRSLFASVFLAVVLSVARRRSIVAQWRDGGRPVAAAEGKKITTIEGLASNGVLHKVQRRLRNCLSEAAQSRTDAPAVRP